MKRMKGRTSTLPNLLAPLFCVAALAAGMVLAVKYNHTDPLPTGENLPAPRLVAPPTVPFPEPVMEPGPTIAPMEGSPTPARSPSSRPSKIGSPSKKTPLDLSAYRPQARSTQGEGYLPKDRSLSANQLKGHLEPKAVSNDEDGHGFLSDVVRGARRVLRSVDDATLKASRSALGDVARPDEAKIRPYADGVRLHIDIPAHTVNLRRKK